MQHKLTDVAVELVQLHQTSIAPMLADHDSQEWHESQQPEHSGTSERQQQQQQQQQPAWPPPEQAMSMKTLAM